MKINYINKDNEIIKSESGKNIVRCPSCLKKGLLDLEHMSGIGYDVEKYFSKNESVEEPYMDTECEYCSSIICTDTYASKGKKELRVYKRRVI